MAEEDRIYLVEMADLLCRRPITLRAWIRDAEAGVENCLPRSLMPRREGGRQRIYWLRAQVEPLAEFAAEREARRGWASVRA